MRQAIAGLVAAAALLIAGCSATVGGHPGLTSEGTSAGTTAAPGTGSSSGPTTPSTTPPTSTSSAPVSTSSPATSTDCPAIIADPSIAFQPSLTDGDVLMVGETGWLSTASTTADVTVTGTEGAVSLTDQQATTFSNCKTSTSTRWVEIRGTAPGTVTLTVAGHPDRAITITVKDR